MEEIELKIERYNSIKKILEVLSKYNICQSYYLNPETGHYILQFNKRSDVPKALFAFIDTPPAELANEEIIEIIEKDEDLKEQYNVYKKII